MRVPRMLALSLCLFAMVACSKPAGAPARTESAVPATTPAPTDAEKQAAIASLPAPYNGGDYLNGKSKFALCSSCHSIAEGGPNMTGPNLHGVFGRKAGSLASFNYSTAIKAAGFVWDGDHLDQWLANPRGFMPGTKMSFIGLKSPKDRIDVIAYLKVESGYKPAP